MLSFFDFRILPTLEKIPRDFLPLFTEVLEGQFDERGLLYRARLFQQLAMEMLNLAEGAMR